MSGCKTVIKKVKDVAEATTLVADWFERENKPATPQSLTDALGSRVAKSLVQKILDQLHTDNKLCVKDLKKIRFYYLNMQGGLAAETSNEGGAAASPLSCDGAAQTGEPLAVDNPEELRTDQEEAAAEDVTALHDVGLAAASLAEHHRRLARWRQWPSRADRVAQRAALEEEVQQLQADIDTLLQRRGAEEGRSSPHSSTESRVARVRRVVRRYRRARQLWTERKRWAMRLLEVTGGDMHSPQKMAALLGCTTDADAAVSFRVNYVSDSTAAIARSWTHLALLNRRNFFSI